MIGVLRRFSSTMKSFAEIPHESRVDQRADLRDLHGQRWLARDAIALFGPSEVSERLTGWESTEVQIRYWRSWSHPDEVAEMDERFTNLHVQLSRGIT